MKETSSIAIVANSTNGKNEPNTDNTNHIDDANGVDIVRVIVRV